MYEKMCSAIHFAIDTVLPARRRVARIHRKVSDRTKDLFKYRTTLRKNGTKEQFAQVQKAIRDSSLADYTEWVHEWANKISDAEGVGDTRGIYKGVKALARKRDKPPTNLNTDKDGNMLKCAEDVAATWHQFLKDKFVATQAERDRPEMDVLPATYERYARPLGSAIQTRTTQNEYREGSGPRQDSH